MSGSTYNKIKRTLKNKSMLENKKPKCKKMTDDNALKKLKTFRNSKVQTDDIKTVCNILAEGKSQPANQTVDVIQPSNFQNSKNKQNETIKAKRDVVNTNESDKLNNSETTAAASGLVQPKSSDEVNDGHVNSQINDNLTFQKLETKDKVHVKENEQQTDLDMKKMNEMIENDIYLTDHKSHLPLDKNFLGTPKRLERETSLNSLKLLKEKESNSLSSKSGDFDNPVIDRKKSVSFAGLTVVDFINKTNTLVPETNNPPAVGYKRTSLDIAPPEIVKTDKNRRRKEDDHLTKLESEKNNLKQQSERPETEREQTTEAVANLVAQQQNFAEQQRLPLQKLENKEQTSNEQEAVIKQQDFQLTKSNAGEFTPLKESTIDKPPTEQSASGKSQQETMSPAEQSKQLENSQHTISDNLDGLEQEDSEDIYDEFDHFALDVAEKLKTMTEDQIILAEKLISSVVISGEFGKLNLHTAEHFKKIHSGTSVEDE